jgi:hypothetical protein
LAVLRFTVISYFTGNCTGRSPGYDVKPGKLAANSYHSTCYGKPLRVANRPPAQEGEDLSNHHNR